VVTSNTNEDKNLTRLFFNDERIFFSEESANSPAPSESLGIPRARQLAAVVVTVLLLESI